jgi:hypothetical protein
MKSLEEKKLLVKMAKMLGQPVDPELVESIEKEERLNRVLFKEEKQEQKHQIAIFEIFPSILLHFFRSPQ